MWYISNPQKTVFIKLDKNGKVITCAKSGRQLFEKNRAENILKNLPKTLKKFHFSMTRTEDLVVSLPFEPKKGNQESEPDILSGDNYEIPPQVLKWQARLTSCNAIEVDARRRKDELCKALTSADRALTNALHKIELGRNLSGSGGYLAYREVREILKSRRYIKDEMYIVDIILRTHIPEIPITKNVEDCIASLKTRKYSMRLVDDDILGEWNREKK